MTTGTAPALTPAITPTGTLRIGLVEGAAAGAVFVSLGADGRATGVTATLGAALARHLALPFETTIYPNSGECTEALAEARIDVSFMPVDAHRQTRVAFGPAYYLLESTFMVSEASGLATLGDVDQPHVRVIGIADTTTIRAATRALRHTTPTPIRAVPDAVAMLRDGQADALALSRDSLAQLLPTMPGARITPGGFQQTTISIAVPPGRAHALAAVTAFLSAAKQDGTVRQAFQEIGLPTGSLAP